MHLKTNQTKKNRTNHPRSYSTDTKTRNGKKRSAAPSISPSPPVNFTTTTIPDSNSIANNTANTAANGTPTVVSATNKAKPTHKKARTQSIETPPSSTSRTPDTSAMSFNNSFSGLKFSYEAQSAPAAVAPLSAPVPSPAASTTPQSVPIKDSPPSSPNSEGGGGARKPSTPSTGEAKDFKIFQNGVHVTHMLGNQLNPASSVAQKMSDQLHMELEANSIYTSSSLDSASQFVGPQFPGKAQAQVCQICALFSVHVVTSNLFTVKKRTGPSSSTIVNVNAWWKWSANGIWKHSEKSGTIARTAMGARFTVSDGTSATFWQ